MVLRFPGLAFGFPVVGLMLMVAACGGRAPAIPGSPEVGATPVASTPVASTPVAPADTGSSAPVSEVSVVVIDDSAITEFYREISPSGEIAGTDRRSLDSALLPDSIQPIYLPKFVSANEASSFLLPEELVMGVDIAGEARAYPVGLMRFREMANDTLGGVPILVTW